jgi:hypothetical protein
MIPINYKIKNIDRKIEMFDGRPDRNTVISSNDILNLKIAFNSKVPKGHDPLYHFLLQV